MAKHARIRGASARHARKKQMPGKNTAVTVIAGAGVALPMVMSGSASAATASQWDRIAQCESGGDWAINHSSDGLSVGGLQFQNPSWKDALGYLNSHGYNTSSWAQSLYQGMPRSSVPTKGQQITAGEALLKLQPNPWLASSSCSGVYLSQSESTFNGGPTPAGFISAGGSPAPVPAPQPTPAPVPTPAPGGGSTGRWWHHWTVAKGDTLYRVAQHAYNDGNQYPRIAKANGIKAPYVIHPGQVLYVP